MVTEKNNMHDVDTSMFFKWVFKAFVAVYLVTHTFDITMAVFDMAPVSYTHLFEGKTIPCISLKGQRVFHSGYELRDKDKHDISILESLSK